MKILAPNDLKKKGGPNQIESHLQDYLGDWTLFKI